MRRKMKVVKATAKDGSVSYFTSAEEMLSLFGKESAYISAATCTIIAELDDKEFLKHAEVVEK